MAQQTPDDGLPDSPASPPVRTQFFDAKCECHRECLRDHAMLLRNLSEFRERADDRLRCICELMSQMNTKLALRGYEAVARENALVTARNPIPFWLSVLSMLLAAALGVLLAIYTTPA